MYTYEWKKSRGCRDYLLYVNVPDANEFNHEVIQKRSKYLKSELIKLIKKNHDEHMEASINKHPQDADLLKDFDPYKAKSWHYSFDPNKSKFVQDLELATLSKKPGSTRSESISEYLKKERSLSKCDAISQNGLVSSNYKAAKAAPNAL